ncbi:MAG: hypothetical protein Q9182_004678 [Xanthomendoza sp. 2 TL-2023]
MDAYIASLEADMSSTGRWMRTYPAAFSKNLTSQKDLQGLKALLEEGASFLLDVDGSQKGEMMRKEIGELVEKIEKWIEGMKKVQ